MRQKNYCIKKLLLLCLILFFADKLYGLTVGSNSTSSRQVRTLFPASQTNNSMQGFSVFEQGLILEDMQTTCTFDAFFPVSGTITLNGGTLWLARDMVLKSPLSIGSGTVATQEAALDFPQNISTIDLPTQGHGKLLTLVQEVAELNKVNSIDWSFDDTYLALATDTVNGAIELKVYYFDGEVLTLTASYDSGSRNISTVRWHPSAYYLALGQQGDIDFKIYYFNTSDGSFTETSSADIGNINAVAWSPNGNYITVGRSSSNTLYVYPVTNGILDTPITTTFTGNNTVQRNSIDWDSTGNYFTIGLTNNNSETELQVYSFNGSVLTKNAEFEIGTHVYAVSWHPTLPLIACGLGGGNYRLAIYEHTAQAGTLSLVTEAGENKNMYGVDWAQDGIYLAAGRQSGSDHMEIRIFRYNQITKSLELVSGYENNRTIQDVRWSHNGNYLATGDTSYYVGVYNFSQAPLIFDNIRLFFNSDVVFKGPIIFKGASILNGSGHIFDLDQIGSVGVSGTSTLIIENAVIRGLKNSNLYCTHDQGLIIFRDSTVLLDGNMTFSIGSFQIKNNVIMGGSGTFAYQTAQTSTILAKSTLILDEGVTFSYDPIIVQSKKLLELQDETSKIKLRGATLHTTVTGMELIKGKLVVERDSFISSERQDIVDVPYLDEGIQLGDSSSGNDCVSKIFSGASLYISQGSLVYKNLESSSWNMVSDTSALRMKTGTALKLYENIDLGEGTLKCFDNTTVARVAGKTITGSLDTQGYVAFTNLN